MNTKNTYVKYKKWNSSLNYNLLIENSTEDNLEELKGVYIKLFKTLEKLENTDNNVFDLETLMVEIENIEFNMQELWGFEKNRNMHRYWFDNDVCTCPKMDNFDKMGTGYRMYNSNCIIHGEETQSLLKRVKKLKRVLKKNSI